MLVKQLWGEGGTGSRRKNLRQYSSKVVIKGCQEDNGKSKNLNPVAIYHNMETDKTQVYKENSGKSGIYRITNKVNGKQYIGSAKNLKARFAHYFSKKSIMHDNMPICKALLKYGQSLFTIEILEYCEPDIRFERETDYLSLLKPEYNIRTR